MGALGRGFGRLGGSSSAQTWPYAPVLTWDANTADTTPNFSVDLPLGNGSPYDVAVDDVLRIQHQPAAGGSFTDYLTHTIIQADIDGNPITESGLTPLSSGDYNFRGRLERGTRLGAWSALEAVTIAVAVPVNSVAPVISGNVQVGQTLSTTNGTWSNTPTSYAYQWKRAGVDIGSATASTYVLVEADAGAAITCAVTASNAGGAGTPATSNSLTVDVYAVFITHVEDPTDGSTFSGGVWNSVSIGVAASNRKIVIGASARTSGTAGAFSSATLDGNSMTSSVSTTSAGGQNKANILIIDKTTGTTGNFALTYTTSQGRAGIGVWAVYGAGSSTPSATLTADTAAGAVATGSLSIPAKGVAIAVASASGTVTATWAGVTEDYDTANEIQFSGAHTNSNAGGTPTVSVTWSSTPSTVGPMAAASWGP